MKISGAEFMEWWDNHFPEGYYWDSMEDMLHNPDGSNKLRPDETYDTNDLGFIASEDPDKFPDNLEADKLIRAWRKSRTHEVVSVAIPKEFYDEITASLKKQNCTVTK